MEESYDFQTKKVIFEHLRSSPLPGQNFLTRQGKEKALTLTRACYLVQRGKKGVRKASFGQNAPYGIKFSFYNCQSAVKRDDTHEVIWKNIKALSFQEEK